MAPGATDEDIAAVVSRVEEVGGEAFVSRGVVRTIIGLVGDVDSFHHLNLRTLRGVADVHRISDPYKLVSRQHHPDRSTVWVGPAAHRVPIGPGTFTFIAGPCAVESHEQTYDAAVMARGAGATLLRGGAYQPRTSPYAAPGLGLAGLEILAEVRHDRPADRHGGGRRPGRRRRRRARRHASGRQPEHAELRTAARGRQTGKPVLLKRGLSATLEEWLMAAEYSCCAATSTWSCASAASGPSSPRPATRSTSRRSPSPRRPATCRSSSTRRTPPAAATWLRRSTRGLAAGAAGLLVDVHPQPESARCDAAQALAGSELRELAQVARRLPTAVGRTDAAAHLRLG